MTPYEAVLRIGLCRLAMKLSGLASGWERRVDGDLVSHSRHRSLPKLRSLGSTFYQRICPVIVMGYWKSWRKDSMELLCHHHQHHRWHRYIQGQRLRWQP